MNDFFADLEAQLRTAHGRRPSRTRRAAAPVAVALALASALALVVALGGGSTEREVASA